MPQATSSRSPVLYVTYLALCCSGAAALAFETLWFREASLAFGNSVWASALVTSAFMAGMGLGSVLVARRRWSAVARLALYAGLELTVAATGVGLVYGLPALSAVFAPFDVQYEDQWLLTRAARLAASLLILLLPSAAMGMTLPLALGGLRAWGRTFGRALSLAYAANTVGAMAGTLLTELVLLEWLGVRRTALFAAALSVTAALLGALLARAAARRGARDVAPPEVEPAQVVEAPARSLPVARRASLPWLSAAALTGFAMLGLEVVWLRMLMLFLADTPLAFAMVLALVLGGIALGSFGAAALLARFPASARYADCVAYAAGAGVSFGVLVFPYALTRFYRLEQDPGQVMLIALPLVLPTAICAGCVLPLVAAARAVEADSERDEGGLVLGANTLGAALGASLVALWLLPTLGMERSLVLLAATYGAAGLALGLGRRARSRRGLAALVAFVIVMLLFPFGALDSTYIRGSVGRWMGEDDRVVAIREGLTATLVHVRHHSDGLAVFDQLATNSYSMSANDFAGRRYMKLFAYLPLAVHPGMRSALVIGFGLGNTAKALTDSPELERIDVVDTSPETLALSRGIDFGSGSPLDDARLKVHLEDGRHYLQGTSDRYDLITGEPPPPFLAGVESLYTTEYFQLVRERLSEGGFATYWLPVMNISGGAARAIVASFCGAFDDCSLWHGSGPNYMLMGSRGATGPVSLERFVHQWTLPSVREELIRLGLEHPVQLGGLFIGDASYLADVGDPERALSDDFPRRMLVVDQPGERAQLLRSWQDTAEARTRFAASGQVAALWPARVRDDSRHQFESQRLLNDLLSVEGAPKSIAVLDQVLTRTPWKLPVLLMLESNPDIQVAILATPHAANAQPSRVRHLLAGRLAERDFAGALAYARALPERDLPIIGLRTYLETRVEDKSK